MNIFVYARRPDGVESTDLWAGAELVQVHSYGSLMVCDLNGQMIYNRENYETLRLIGKPND